MRRLSSFMSPATDPAPGRNPRALPVSSRRVRPSQADRVTERWVPDAFVFALLATLVVGGRRVRDGVAR